MEIEVYCRSKYRKTIIEHASRFYGDCLNLQNSKYGLQIYSIKNLVTCDDTNGQVVPFGQKNIIMQLNSSLNLSQLLYTLAHEMVHVKQIAKGQYKSKKSKGGKLLPTWMGKVVETNYINRPWEVEAFKREGILVNMLHERLCVSNSKI